MMAARWTASRPSSVAATFGEALRRSLGTDRFRVLELGPLDLDVLAEPEKRPWGTERASGPHQLKPDGLNILLVDDEPSMRELLGIMLRKEGYDVSQ